MSPCSPCISFDQAGWRFVVSGKIPVTVAFHDDVSVPSEESGNVRRVRGQACEVADIFGLEFVEGFCPFALVIGRAHKDFRYGKLIG